MIIEYCATRLIPKMKIDFHPNKRRLILLSCPLQLISIDSRSPNGLHSLPNFKMVIKMCFNSRSPSRLRLSISAVYIVLLPVSIHAAQAGCDRVAFEEYVTFAGFQFTQPKRAATSCWSSNVFRRNVSIHAAQAGCDSQTVWRLCKSRCFNSRSPSGLRLVFTCRLMVVRCFNSRSPSGLRPSS